MGCTGEACRRRSLVLTQAARRGAHLRWAICEPRWSSPTSQSHFPAPASTQHPRRLSSANSLHCPSLLLQHSLTSQNKPQCVYQWVTPAWRWWHCAGETRVDVMPNAEHALSAHTQLLLLPWMRIPQLHAVITSPLRIKQRPQAASVRAVQAAVSVRPALSSSFRDAVCAPSATLCLATAAPGQQRETRTGNQNLASVTRSGCCTPLCAALARSPACSYAPPGERRSLPLCATQFFPSAEAPAEDRNSWQAVTVDKPHPLSRATAADLAASWARGEWSSSMGSR
jgi:hypothetical protein